jgi:hypothetical protein
MLVGNVRPRLLEFEESDEKREAARLVAASVSTESGAEHADRLQRIRELWAENRANTAA